LAVAAALLSLFGKWFQSKPLVFAAVAAFLVSILWSIFAAIRMVQEIEK